MSKVKCLSKKKWLDFRKSIKKLKWIRLLKFPRHNKMLKDVQHIGMGKPKQKVINYPYQDLD